MAMGALFASLGCGRGPTPARSRGAPPPREDRPSGPVAADTDSEIVTPEPPPAGLYGSSVTAP